MNTVKCKKCGSEIDPLAVFPGGICLGCHEKKFNAEVARNGGILPRPDFSKILAKATGLRGARGAAGRGCAVNLENFVKAMQTAEMLRDELREMHRGAEPFAEILALDLIQDIAAFQNKLNRFADAARVKGGAM